MEKEESQTVRSVFALPTTAALLCDDHLRHSVGESE